MNTTANKATKRLDTAEATEPTMPLTLPKSTNSLILSMMTTVMSKSRSKLGKVAISQSFRLSMGLNSK